VKPYQNHILILIPAGIAVTAGFLFISKGVTGMLIRAESVSAGWFDHPLMLLGFSWIMWCILAVGLTMKIVRRVKSDLCQGVRINWFHSRTLLWAAFISIMYSSLMQFLIEFEDWDPQLSWQLGAALSVTLGIVFYIWSVYPDLAAWSRSHRGWNFLDVALTNLIIVILGLECFLSLYIRVNPSPLFYESKYTVSRIDAHRMLPGQLYFNFRCNSQGYYDREFFRAGESDLVVAVITDSFGVGRVPYSYNFITLAESRIRDRFGEEFDRVAIHNFGIPCMEVAEYAHLLETEVLQTNPNLVVLCVFVGNDIVGLREAKTSKRCLQKWWIYRVPKRFTMLSREKSFAEITQNETMREEVPPYIFDASVEPPTFTEEAFLSLESDRLAVCDPVNPESVQNYREFFQALDYFRHRLEQRLAIAVIPDEFQVNDSLYEALLAIAGENSSHHRELPQNRIKTYCERYDIPCLDFLPVIRFFELDDRTYHRRDTHWNARGNRAAGDSLGEFIHRILVERLEEE
jgi:hypothetical protein